MPASPTITVADSSAQTLAVDAVVVGIFALEQDKTKAGDKRATAGKTLALGPGAADVDTALDGQLTQVLAQLGATGKVGEVTKLATLGATKAPIVVAVGLGKKPDEENDIYRETVRKASGAAIAALAGTAKVGIALASDNDGVFSAAAEGALLSAYDFVTYKSVGDGYRAPVPAITLLAPKKQHTAAKPQLARATTLARSTYTTRDWINTPPNHLRPPEFADQAAKAAKAAGLKVEVLDEPALRKGGYGGILAVGGGSVAGPRLVVISYRPAKKSPKKVALVGKGITFDSGGISIKPTQGMDEMKSDMSGAAAVIGAMLAIAELKPAVAVTAYVPMAENLPSGTAYRPGDVVTLYGGKTVEILNTDAEGRIILGDAIARACEDKPDYLIETSTLTGGQVISLGKRVAGLMGTEELLERIKQAGARVGEPMWPMPLPDEIRASMDSSIADILQISAGMERSGHMLQGGTFLRELVADDIPWAHIDIAGPSFNSGPRFGYIGKGGTGVPLRTLVEIIDDIATNG